MLKPGAVLRVSVPDLAKLAALYQRKDPSVFPDPPEKDPLPFLNGDRFCSYLYSQEMNTSAKPSLIRRFQEFFLRRHQWMYDEESFAALMTAAGFSEIRSRGYRETELEEARQLDHHPEISLFLEGRKSAG